VVSPKTDFIPSTVQWVPVTSADSWNIAPLLETVTSVPLNPKIKKPKLEASSPSSNELISSEQCFPADEEYSAVIPPDFDEENLTFKQKLARTFQNNILLPEHNSVRTVDIEEELNKQDLYKTELCKSWVESGGFCRYGEKCQFAHGPDELRPIFRHPKYKTEICKTFYTYGTCPYGKRCRFVHHSPTENSPPKEPENEEPKVEVETKSKRNGSKLPFFQKLHSKKR